jgi:membrane protein insertase Oxa1/YidC/SpoIIIJ
MVYWLTTNLWTTGQGVVTRRMMPKPDLSAIRRSSRTAPKDEPAPTSRRKTSAAPKPAVDGSPPKPVAGPPRRVKRKRSGGGRRR